MEGRIKQPNTDLEVTECTQGLDTVWDEYVRNHPNATYCHLSAWRNVFGKTYGQKYHYLVARHGEEVLGILPLFYVRGLNGKGSLISMPFLDAGGVLAHNLETETQLLSGAISLAKSLKADNLELRCKDLPQWACKINNDEGNVFEKAYGAAYTFHYSIRQVRVRMLMEMPGDQESLMSSFKSKLRSQIKKSIKEGCEPVVGGSELVDQFYKVFAVNMRDLGSPVHSKQLFVKLFEFFPDEARIFLIRKGDTPIAGSVTIGFREMLSNPWASSLREYSHMGPNMLLYWKMLEYACQKGFAYFDFGRSAPYEGTFKFKEQWGAVPHKLSWIYATPSHKTFLDTGYDRSRFERAITCWKKLPVPLTKLIGPILRKHIAL